MSAFTNTNSSLQKKKIHTEHVLGWCLQLAERCNCETYANGNSNSEGIPTYSSLCTLFSLARIYSLPLDHTQTQNIYIMPKPTEVHSNLSENLVIVTQRVQMILLISSPGCNLKTPNNLEIRWAIHNWAMHYNLTFIREKLQLL